MRRKLKPPVDDYPRPWEERPIPLERWQRHRERMLAELGHGRRPDEWWLYERNMERPCDGGDEQRLLYEMGELSKAEAAELMAHWRECFDRANEPDFSHHTGSKILEGAAARRAEYRWVGIPREILKKWNAERGRRARRIKRLLKDDQPIRSSA